MHNKDTRSWAGSLLASGLAALALLQLGAAADCDSQDKDEPPGAVVFDWRVSPRGCQESGVAQIQASLSGPTQPAADALVFPCADEEGTITQLAPGSYAVTLEGLTSDGKATFASERVPFNVSPQTVTTLTEEIRLAAKPARIDLSWFFANGRLCAFNGVSEVRVEVFDSDDFSAAQGRFVCEDGVGTIEALQSGSYTVEVLAISSEGEIKFREILEVEVGRGDVLPLEVRLENCEDC
jgi:hypothetical protein